MKVLVIAPHPDDEVLGCGGTIVKHIRQGDEVYLCFVTKAYTPDWSEAFLEERKKEINRLVDFLKIRKAFFLDFPTAKLDTVPQKMLNDSIFKIIDKVRPHIVYIPHLSDLNKDHRLVYEATLVATRPVPMRHKVKRILAYETLSETEWGPNISPFLPNVYIDITDTIKTKIEAMKIYKSELKEYPHPRSIEIIEAHAKKRGAEAGVKYAEAFSLVREIIE